MGYFPAQLCLNLTECINSEGITFLPDPRNSLADDSTSSFLYQNCMNNGA